MDRVILHCDINSFYASVEELYHPETRGLPIAVGGSVDERHGIILTKNQQAKKYGVQTGEALWQAKLKCPNLIIYPPNYQRYLLYSQKIRKIFHEYTDLVEPFGLDEAWLDVTASSIYGNGKQIADKLREIIFNQMGVTCSVGVSFNKIFAKLGSDLRKPNYTTVITRDDFKEIVWPLPANEMLYVGKSTYETLRLYNINTIGDIANTSENKLCSILGKWGSMLHDFASGQESSPVARYDEKEIVKSIGNSITCYRDLANSQDVDIVLWVLCESVASRMRDQGFKCKQVTLYFRDNKLNCFTRQMPINATNIASEIMQACRTLYKNNYYFQIPLRSIGVCASKLTTINDSQLSLFVDETKREKQLLLEKTIDEIRERYGFNSIKRLCLKLDEPLSDFNPKGEHIIFPESYLR